MVCTKCANEITGEIIRCGGFCSSEVCMRCSGLSTALLAAIQGNAHCIWICTACKNLLGKARFTNAMVSVNAVNEYVTESLKTEIKDSILSEIRENFKTLMASTPQPQTGTAKRQREGEKDDPSPVSASKRVANSTNCVRGTAQPTVNDADLFASTSMVASNVFWLYMRGFRPDISSERVSEWLHTKLGTNDIKVRKLVPRGRDVSELSFVSFKVGLPVELKDIALCKETWPSQIMCREFEENRSELGFDPDDLKEATSTQPQTQTLITQQIVPPETLNSATTTTELETVDAMETAE